MTHSTPVTSDPVEPRSRPNVAVVFVSRRNASGLDPEVEAAAAVLGGFGVEALAMAPARPEAGSGAGSSSFKLRLLEVDPGEDEAVRRARALTGTDADILEFVDAQAARSVPWDEVAPVRVGLVRMDVDSPVDVRAALVRLGVPDPAAPGGEQAEPKSQPGLRAPLLSVVVPVRDGAEVIGPCLNALARSDLPRHAWELIVVDDGSLDGTTSIAAAWADVLVRVPGPPHGPAYARNRGVEAALGAILVFIDADVCVHPDTLRRMAWQFARQPDLGAVFGSYDVNPPAQDDVSQYRNLRHHYVHNREAGEAETFWSACGGVRREAFVRAGRFDEWHFPRPQIEDVELGYRLRALGYRILLDPSIEGTHLKKWSLRDVVIADLRDRGVPWIRLQLALGVAGRPATLLFRPSEWVGSGSVCLAALLLVEAGLTRLLEPVMIAGLILGIVLVSNAPMYRFFWRRRGLGFALRIMPLHLLYYLMNGLAAAWAWLLFHLVGPPAPPAEIQAYAEKGLKAWPPLPSKPEASSWLVGRSAPRSG